MSAGIKRRQRFRYKKMKIHLLICFLLLVAININAEPRDSLDYKIYRIKPSIDGPLLAVTAVTYFWGQHLASSG